LNSCYFFYEVNKLMLVGVMPCGRELMDYAHGS